MPPKAEKTRGSRWYEVKATKKGELPVKEEKRPKGKAVTIVSNIKGHEEALLKHLQERLGVGGSLQNGNVELQGRHQAKVEAFLKDSDHVKGMRKEREADTAHLPVAELAELAELSSRGTKRSKGATFVPPKPEPVLRAGKVRPPCWDWIYCSGQCLQEDYVLPSDDLSDVYEELFYEQDADSTDLQKSRSTAKLDVKSLDAGLKELGMFACGPIGGYTKTTQTDKKKQKLAARKEQTRAKYQQVSNRLSFSFLNKQCPTATALSGGASTG
jgi:translation initiation factor 1 (eIF-1/SUI1)